MTQLFGTDQLPVLAATNWTTNGHLIEDIARLGYLHEHHHTLDPTYGLGTFWTRWQPHHLTATDIDPNKAPHAIADFTHLPFTTGRFDAAVFDPPYIPAPGDTATLTKFHNRYGLGTSRTTTRQNQALIDAGLTEVTRVVLVKCMDYNNARQFWPGTYKTTTTALTLGCRLHDRLEHLRRPGANSGPGERQLIRPTQLLDPPRVQKPKPPPMTPTHWPTFAGWQTDRGIGGPTARTRALQEAADRINVHLEVNVAPALATFTEALENLMDTATGPALHAVTNHQGDPR